MGSETYGRETVVEVNFNGKQCMAIRRALFRANTFEMEAFEPFDGHMVYIPSGKPLWGSVTWSPPPRDILKDEAALAAWRVTRREDAYAIIAMAFPEDVARPTAKRQPRGEVWFYAIEDHEGIRRAPSAIAAARDLRAVVTECERALRELEHGEPSAVTSSAPIVAALAAGWESISEWRRLYFHTK